MRCANFNLRKASRAVTQYYDSVLRPAGLKATQFSLLTVLVVEGPLPLSAFADALVMDRTTLTRNLRPLIDRGLVREVGGTDRRQRILDLTESGRRTQAEALPLWRSAQKKVETKLGSARLDRLIADLNAAVDVTRRG
ncbi:MAG: winged helix-turn-helix transcriptional regulator [Alphaproteobacteria bacterium]|nr:winged helix-turn-helix transcriptional regulator [Alphaproteobacteria bacterium]